MDEERGGEETASGSWGGGDTGGHQIREGIAFGSNRNIFWEGVHQITEGTAFEFQQKYLGDRGSPDNIIINY